MELREQTSGHDLHVPTNDEDPHKIVLAGGEVLFMLGANGSGKSSLILSFYTQAQPRAHRISAHRQTWIRTDKSNITANDALNLMSSIRNYDTHEAARYTDSLSDDRVKCAIYKAIEEENVRARKFLKLAKELGLSAIEVEEERNKPTLLEEISYIFRQSKIHIDLSRTEESQLVASKNGGSEFGVAQMSDGERSALLTAIEVLTAPSGTLLLIDEPERHLHRSISAPLISQLVKFQKNCSFVISTHDHELPLGFENSKVLLLRSISYGEKLQPFWDIDEISPDSPINRELKRELIGSERQILYVEGDESSLDVPLYRILFPMATVISRGDKRTILKCVSGLRDSQNDHWLKCYGIVDRDGSSDERFGLDRERRIFTLPLYSVESIYFHSKMIKIMAEMQSKIHPSVLKKTWSKSAIEKVKPHVDRLCREIVEKHVRENLHRKVHDNNDLLNNERFDVPTNSSDLLTKKLNEVNKAIEDENWDNLLILCPIHKTGAPMEIAKALKFPHWRDYTNAVCRVLSNDNFALNVAREFFSELIDELKRPEDAGP